MELAFEQKQRSCLHRTAHLSLAQEQTQELIIPDSMPDASRTLICCAEPEVQSKNEPEGSLLVTGGTLRTGCLYADEAGGLQLTSELPFTVKLEWRRAARGHADARTLLRPQRGQPPDQLAQGAPARERSGSGGRLRVADRA